jgi:hypothetical protein
MSAFGYRDPLELLFRRLDNIGNVGGFGAQEQPAYPPLSEEEFQGTLRSVLDKSLGGLQWVGETLDKPGRAVRGVLAGRPEELLNLIPFSDTLGITDPEQSVSGRQLLEQYGALDANTEGLDAGDVAGFAAEVLLDPTTYLTFGGSALSKGGQALKGAGALTKAELKASSRISKTVGSLVDALKATDEVKHAKAMKALESAAEASGVSLDALRAQSVGGLARWHIPFTNAEGLIGTNLSNAVSIPGIGERLFTSSTPDLGKLANISVGALDKLWSRDPGAYLPPGGSGTNYIGDRYQGVLDYLGTGKSVEAPRVSVRDGGSVVFGDGRHRFSVLRDLGVDTLPMTLSPESYANAQKLGLLAPEAGGILTGAIPERIAGGLDSLGNMLRYGSIPGTTFSPGQHLAALFSPQELGVAQPELSPFAQSLSQTRDDIIRSSRESVAQDVTARHAADLMTDEASTQLRRLSETGELPFPVGDPRNDILSDISKKWGKSQDELLEQAHDVGLKQEPLVDPAGIKRVPRQFVDEVPNASFRTRAEHLKGWLGGTDTVRQIIRDPAIRSAASLEDAVKHIKDAYGDRFVGVVDDPGPKYMEGLKGVGKPTRKGMFTPVETEALSTLANNVRTKYTPEQIAVGGFGNDVLADIQAGDIGERMHIAKAQTQLDAIRKFAVPVTRYEGKEAAVRVSDLLDNIGLQAEFEGGQGALPYLMRKMGLDAKDATLKQSVMNMVLPERLAKGLVDLNKGFDIPEAVRGVMSMFDMGTNLFKVGVLTWPARHVRDLMTGQLMNALTGNWSPSAASDALKLVRGELIEDAEKKYPAVALMLVERGLEQNAKNATAMLRELSYADQMFTAAQGVGGTGQLSGAAAHAAAGRTQELLSEVPGLDPLTMKSVATAGDSLNPLKIRGVTDSATKFRPVAISEQINRFSDGMNRLVPYLKNIAEGVDPKQAAELVNALQVNYKPEAFTKFERTVLKRLFPFYSFNRKMIPEIVRQLAERPGGGIAQTIRASNAPRQGDAYIPDYVSEGLAIPLGDEGRYITGFGLMHEALSDMIGIRPTAAGTMTRTAQKVGSMLNPTLRMPIEMATGVNLFTGRPQTELYQYPTDSPMVNMLLGNSPLSRTINTVRKVGDERKEPWVKALALGTGVGITDISGGPKKAMELEGRKVVEEILKQSPRIREVRNLYVPKELKGQETADERLYMRFVQTLQKKRKDAAKQKQAIAAP